MVSPVSERDEAHGPEMLEQTMRDAGFCQDCQKSFHWYDSAYDLRMALQRYHSRWTPRNPPAYVMEKFKLFTKYHCPVVMDNGSRNIVLGVTLEKFVEDRKVEERCLPFVNHTKQGQSMEQGVCPGDKVVAVNGWWLPPEGHPTGMRSERCSHTTLDWM
jgi:arginyl-tRNA--protein-N-Asp/Glu arginylyltransferase